MWPVLEGFKTNVYVGEMFSHETPEIQLWQEYILKGAFCQ